MFSLMKPTQRKNKFVHRNSGKMCVRFYFLEPDYLIANCEVWNRRNQFAQSRCVGVASVHSVIDSSSFSTRSSLYRPFMLSVSMALIKEIKTYSR